MQKFDSPNSAIGRRPTWVAFSVWLVPAAILFQFLLAGLALFDGTDLWEVHCFTGFLIGLPILAVLIGAAILPGVRALAPLAGLVFADLVLQILLAAATKLGGPTLFQSLHVLNGGVLLMLSILLLGKLNRREMAW